MDQIKLNNGKNMPVLGLGTWNSPKGKVKAAVKFALTKAKYKHIDCAAIYKNEPEIGEAFEESFAEEVKREEIFVTSKLWNTAHRPEDVERTCKKTLRDLKLDYLDLYLIHWGIAFDPSGGSEPLNKDGVVKTIPISIAETWKAMEGLVEKGLVKSIGVSNFTTVMILDLLTHAKVKPAVNQIEVHAYNNQEDLVKYCKYNNVAATAYSPLGTPGGIKQGEPRLIEDEVVTKIAAKYDKSPAQVLLRWNIQRGVIVIPKSVTPERIQENIEVFDFELGDEDMKEINSLNQNHRFVDPINWWGIPYFK